MDEVDSARAANGHAMPVLGEGSILIIVPDDNGHMSTIVMINSLLFIPALHRKFSLLFDCSSSGHRL